MIVFVDFSGNWFKRVFGTPASADTVFAEFELIGGLF